MPGGGDPVGGGLWQNGDGRVTFLPGAIEGVCALQGVWVGYGGWIDGRAHEVTTWYICR